MIKSHVLYRLSYRLAKTAVAPDGCSGIRHDRCGKPASALGSVFEGQARSGSCLADQYLESGRIFQPGAKAYRRCAGRWNGSVYRSRGPTGRAETAGACGQAQPPFGHRSPLGKGAGHC